MRRDEALTILSSHRPQIEAFGVESLALFGSVARDEASPESDVDILVEFAPDARVGLFRFLDLKEYLEQLLGCRVDLVTVAGLKPQFRDSILRESIRVAA